MTHKTTMPEPITTSVLHDGKWLDLEMITTDQAEAYAKDRVQESLEEAAEIADSMNAFPVYDAIRALIPKEE